jgi:hypothetical protein
MQALPGRATTYSYAATLVAGADNSPLRTLVPLSVGRSSTALVDVEPRMPPVVAQLDNCSSENV